MLYRIELTPQAAKELKKLPKQAQKKVARWLDLLAIDPRCEGAIQLSGTRERLFRVHAGKDYVIVYGIREAALLVLVVRIANRKDVYRGL